MKKKKSSIYWWVISPTYKCAERRKYSLLNSGATKTEISVSLKKYNLRFFLISILFCFIFQALVSFGNCLHEGGFYSDEITKWIFGGFAILISWGLFISRSIEIFKAFLEDAVEKLNDEDSISDLKYGERLQLSFKSYLELIFNFAIVYFIVPCWFYKDSFEFSSILEAIYFSGVTITTLGYGDISPTNPVLQILSVLEVLSGFALIVVSFAIYSSLAIGGRESK